MPPASLASRARCPRIVGGGDGMAVDGERRPRADLATVAGLALLLMPLTTMWHEIGGHALACAVQGGRLDAIGAFYVDCQGLAGWPKRIVALGGASMDAIAAGAAYLLWRRARGDLARLVLWYIWVTKAFVAAGYIGFSGVSGFGDLAPGRGAGGGLGAVPYPGLFRAAEVVVGIALYAVLVRAAIASLAAMIGRGPATRQARRRIAHGYYLVGGSVAVLIGLVNPLGLVITLMSAAAATFGGLAGFISIGFAEGRGDEPLAFAVHRRPGLIAAGVAAAVAFAAILGPTLHP